MPTGHAALRQLAERTLFKPGERNERAAIRAQDARLRLNRYARRQGVLLFFCLVLAALPWPLLPAAYAAGPEIAVSVEGNELVAGQLVVIPYGTTSVGAPILKTFTIRNGGTEPLSLGAARFIGSGFSLVTAFPAGPVAADSSITFQIRLDAAAPGAYGATFEFFNGDGDESPFSFPVTGSVTGNGTTPEPTPVPTPNPTPAPAPAPEIALASGGALLTNGQDAPVNFGKTRQGRPVTRTFTVHNLGSAPLSLGAVTLPAGYTLTSAPPASVAPGGSVSFVVRLDATSPGQRGGLLVLADNDADEAPFQVPLSGSVQNAVYLPAVSR